MAKKRKLELAIVDPKNPAKSINDWTIEHFKEMYVLVDKDGKEIEYEVSRS